jgi:hypothetical protein
MKKTALTIIMTILMVSVLTIILTILLSGNEPNVNNTKNNKPKVESVMGELDHGGLYKVKIDDSTTILIYRGNQSCTMLQLK